MVLVTQALCAILAAGWPTQEDAAKVDYFNTSVLPLLKARCYKCHSHDAGKAKGGLVLDSRNGWLKGGKLGPAIVPGNPDQSLLFTAVTYADEDLEMPPKKQLSRIEIGILRRWIADGAVDPRTAAVGDASGAATADEMWSFQPVRNSKPPTVDDPSWSRTDVDRFVLASLEAASLKPVGDADRRTLIRRLFLDLTGLPPSPEDMTRWSEARDLEPLVDHLLDSPHFGETWARHWLDTARYGDSNGKARNRVYRYAWRYRNWVIDAFNSDKPYDAFLKEQLAGDLMPHASARQRTQQRIATGFLAIGSKPYYPTIVPFDKDEPDRARFQWAAEQINATFSGMMALTVGCAECHDHKFDPIPTRDYYALAGIFRSTEQRFGMWYNLKEPTQSDFLYDWNLLVLNDEILKDITLPQKEYQSRVAEERILDLRSRHYPNQIENHRIRIAKLKTIEGNEEQIRKIEETIERKASALAQGKKRLPQLIDEKARLRKAFRFNVDQTVGVEDGANPRDVHLRIAGDHARKGPLVPRGFLSTLAFKGAPSVVDSQASGRLQLAGWIAHPNNPLTARVAVNRIWHHLFGHGIVPTLDNFGTSGEKPTHPELLDHLAHRFVHDFRWSPKRLIRYLLASRTYRLASDERHVTKAHFEKDPGNTHYWRMTPRRLPAESIRDSMLAVSGRLDRRPPPGSMLTSFHYDDSIHRLDLKKALEALSTPHRTIYLPALRGTPHRLYALFDYPDAEAVNSARDISNVPTQALYLMNNPIVMEYADHLARRLPSTGSEIARLETLYSLCYARAPAPDEVDADLAFLKSMPDHATAWSRLAHSFLISGEFLWRR